MSFSQQFSDFLNKHSLAGFTQAQVFSSPFPTYFFEAQSLCFHLVSPLVDTDYPTLFELLQNEGNQRQIKIVHLWQDLWQHRQALTQARILALLGQSQRIHARLCEVRRIDQPTAAAFLDQNHLQYSTSAKFKYGLFVKPNYQNRYAIEPPQLVAVATFSTARRFVRNQEIFRSFELLRFANLQGHTVVGGLDKLIQAFIRNHHPDDLMTYADADWSLGESYLKLGFEATGVLAPQSFVVVDSRRVLNRMPDTSNIVWNSGSIKFIKYFK